MKWLSFLNKGRGRETGRASKLQLPALQGSKTQIAQAETIRTEQVDILYRLDNKLANAPSKTNPEAVRRAREIIKYLITRPDAKDWIKTRDQTVHYLRIYHQIKNGLREISQQRTAACRTETTKEKEHEYI